MRFLALATDYDGTIAWHSSVEESTCNALRQFRDSGRNLLLVTGRELHDLFGVFGHPDLFELIVAENGAVLYRPSSSEAERLAPPPPPEFVTCLRQRGVHPLSVGQSIVATQETYHGVVAEAIEELRLDLRIIPNKGALMVLPRDVDKGSGLRCALARLNLSPTQVVGVGDAENDFAFLSLCGLSVAVANALPELKGQVQYVTRSGRGHGVEELIAKLLANEVADLAA